MSDTGVTRPGFRADVQGLRMLAVVLVVVFHSGFALPGGYLGVDVFFVISGFVIGRMLVFEQESTGRVALANFYARRVRRLLPALSVMLIVVALVSIVGVSPIGPLRATIAKVGGGAALYAANVATLVFQSTSYFALGETTNPYLHTWTLAVEEQFYLLFPLLLVVLGRLVGRKRKLTRRTLTVAVAVAALGSFLLGALLNGSISLFGWSLPPLGRVSFFSSPTRAWEFLAGVLVALSEPLVRERFGVRRIWIEGTALIGLAAILWSGFALDSTVATPGPWTLVPVLGAVAVIVAGCGTLGTTQRFLSSRPVVWIGDRSYGWYLWHWPMIVLYRTSFPTAPNWVLLVVGIAALVPTELSYRYLEEPFRSNARWSGWRAVGLAATCSGLAILSMLLLAWFPNVSSAGEKSVVESLTPTGPAPAGCLVQRRALDPRGEYHCDWPVAKARGSVVLIGDSQAGMFADVLAQQANQAGYSMHVSYRPSCPFADIERIALGSTATDNCHAYIERSMTALLFTHPDLVVIASLEDTYVHNAQTTMRDPVTGDVGEDDASRARIWRDGLRRTVTTLTDHGIRVAVITTVPQLSPFNIGLCPAWRLWTKPAGCARTLSRASVEAYRRTGLQATRAALEGIEGAKLVDFTDDLCGPASCSTLRGDTWMYANAAHLSAAGAMTLGPTIASEIISMVRQ